MSPKHCVTLLTDYGLEDGFVAACHGVIARLCPHARIIDITHLVPPGDVRRGAAIMAQTIPYLPAGVHVAVVDPGVGTPRRAVALEAGDRVFVGPDNGVLSWTAAGPDLRQLLIGSEGTFGVITRVRLRVHRIPEAVRYEAWERAVALDAAARWGQDPDELRPQVFARVVVAAMRGVFTVWLASPQAELRSLVVAAFDDLGRGFG